MNPAASATPHLGESSSGLDALLIRSVAAGTVVKCDSQKYDKAL